MNLLRKYVCNYSKNETSYIYKINVIINEINK